MSEKEINNQTGQEPLTQLEVNRLHKEGKLIYEKLCNNQILSDKSISVKLKDEIKDFNQRINGIGKTLEKYGKLAEQKVQVEDDFKKLVEEETTLAGLQEKNKAIQRFPEILAQIEHIEGKNTAEIGKILDSLLLIDESLTAANSDLEDQLIEKTDVLKKNLMLIKKNQEVALEKLSLIPLENKLKDLKKLLNGIISEYNVYVEKIQWVREELEMVSKYHESIVDDFKAHHLENITVYGDLRSRNGVLTYVEILSDEIKERLAIFDNEIREVMENREQLPIHALKEMIE